MDFGLDEEQRLIVSTVRRFADRELAGWGADADRAGAPPPRLLELGAELGFLIDAVPADRDGLLDGAYPHLPRTLRALELGRACSGLAALLETNVEPALAVGRWGTDAARQALFAALTGGGLAAFAHDAAGRLRVRGAVGGVVLDGQLGPVPALGAASHLLLSARTEAGPMLLLVPVDAVEVEAVVPSGWRAARWGKLRARAAALGPEWVVARGDDAAAAVTAVLTWYRLNLAARAVGAATAALAHTARYGEERVQFDQPIGRFESIAHLQDAGETQVAAARLLALHAAWLVDTGAPEAADVASRARDLAARTFAQVAIDAVQIFGGYGFVNDFPVEKLMRDARAYEVLGGNEAFERVLARRDRKEA